MHGHTLQFFHCHDHRILPATQSDPFKHVNPFKTLCEVLLVSANPLRSLHRMATIAITRDMLYYALNRILPHRN